MNRDKAIEIAADSWPHDRRGSAEWADVVVRRADALLAAMGETKPRCVHDCCCSTVVTKIADYLDNGGYSGAGAMVRSGDWRAKEPVR
jgi:hypothetical protein